MAVSSDGNGTVQTHHVDGLRVYHLGNHAPLRCHELYELRNGRPFDLFVLEVTQRVEIEIENDATLT